MFINIFTKFFIILGFLMPSFVLNAQNFEDRSKNSLTNKIIKAYEEGSIDHPTMIKNRLNALVDIEKVDKQFIDGTPIIEKCATTNVLELKAEVEKLSKTGDLSPNEVNSIEGVLTRVTKQFFLVSPSGKFRIQYDKTGTHAVYEPTVDVNPADGHPDYVNRTAEIFDYVYNVEVTQMGYTPPPPDGTSGGGIDQYDVYMHIYSGAYGVCFSDGTVSNYGTPPRTAYKSYIYVDPTYEGFGYTDRTLPLKVTAAHEYFHAIQFAYNINAGNWFMEISSTWIEDLVYDEINDYRYYLAAFFNSPKTSLTKFDGSHEYASCIYGHYISENFGNNRMKRMWDYTVNAGSNIANNAIQSALAEIGTNRSDVFAGFTVWNYLTGSRANGTHTTYSEGSSFPSINIATTNSTYPVSATAPTGLEFLATFYHHFFPVSTLSNLRLGFNQISTSAWRGKVVVDSSNRFRSFDVDLSSGSGTTDLLSFNDKTRAVFIPSNVATTGTNLSYSYIANIRTLPTVLTPNGGELVFIDSVYNITWTSSGITDVKIEYTTNNGTNWLTIAESRPASPASFQWTIPPIPTTQARVRVTSTSDPNLSDISNNVFSIQFPPSITLISPDGGEMFPIGFQKNIQWSSVNVSGNVKIELSRDGGINYEDLFASTPNDGNENWIVSENITEQTRIKITSITLPTVFDVSNLNFFIRTATITVLLPNGSEIRRIGTSDTVRWQSSNMSGNVKIEVSRNSGTSYETIFASTANDSSEMWTPETPLSNSARIRILAIGNSNIFDESDNNFYIYPQDFISISSPQKNDNFLVGTEYPVTWGSFGTSGFVKIELSKDSGLIYETLFESTADDGIALLTFSFPTTAQALIKISDAANSDLSSTSEVFLIGVYDSIKYREGWNILSLPSVAVPNSKSQIFPGATSNIFGYVNNAYVTTDIIQSGKGYWVKFAKDSTTRFIGAQRLVDTSTVSNGWNLIGGISVPVNIASIKTEPSGLIASLFFTFKNGYKSIDTVYPGDGIWIKSNNVGKFIFDISAPQTFSTQKFLKSLTKLNSIRFTDKLNNSQVLYYSNSSKQTDEYLLSELPPRPSENLFDVRFQSNKFIEQKISNSQKEYPILLQGITFPLTIKWNTMENIEPLLKVEGLVYQMEGNGEFILTDASFSRMVLKLEESATSVIPSEYELFQNYPNPFNPTTKIRFGIPKSSFVSLKIFNILGVEVSDLVDEFCEAGYHEVELNINQENNLSSGVYYIQMKTDNVLLTKQAVILK